MRKRDSGQIQKEPNSLRKSSIHVEEEISERLAALGYSCHTQWFLEVVWRIVRRPLTQAQSFNRNQSVFGSGFGLFQSLPQPFRWTTETEALGTRLGRQHQRNLSKSVPHEQQDYFPSFNQFFFVFVLRCSWCCVVTVFTPHCLVAPQAQRHNYTFMIENVSILCRHPWTHAPVS